MGSKVYSNLNKLLVRIASSLNAIYFEVLNYMYIVLFKLLRPKRIQANKHIEKFKKIKKLI